MGDPLFSTGHSAFRLADSVQIKSQTKLPSPPEPAKESDGQPVDQGNDSSKQFFYDTRFKHLDFPHHLFPQNQIRTPPCPLPGPVLFIVSAARISPVESSQGIGTQGANVRFLQWLNRCGDLFVKQLICSENKNLIRSVIVRRAGY